MLNDSEFEKHLEQAKYFAVSEGEIKSIEQAKSSSKFIEDVNTAKKDIKENKVIGNEQPQKFAKLSAIAHWSRVDINRGKIKVKDGLVSRDIDKIKLGLEQMKNAVNSLSYIGSAIDG